MAQILQICSGNKKRFYNAERLRTIEKNVINSTDEVKNKNIPVSGDWKKTFKNYLNQTSHVVLARITDWSYIEYK